MEVKTIHYISKKEENITIKGKLSILISVAQEFLSFKIIGLHNIINFL